jgi:DNA helicase-2/ATP-dependent DNA helicase PcrA
VSQQKTTNQTDSTPGLMVGHNIMHERFGKGKVLKLEGQGADKKATIFFPQHGSKTVLLRFANIQILED